MAWMLSWNHREIVSAALCYYMAKIVAEIRARFKDQACLCNMTQILRRVEGKTHQKIAVGFLLNTLHWWVFPSCFRVAER